MIFLNYVMTRGVHHRQPLKRKLVGLMTVQPETPVLGFKTHTLNIFQMARSSSKGRANHTSYYSLPTTWPHPLLPPSVLLLLAVYQHPFPLLPLYLPKIKNHACDKRYT